MQKPARICSNGISGDKKLAQIKDYSYLCIVNRKRRLAVRRRGGTDEEQRESKKLMFN